MGSGKWYPLIGGGPRVRVSELIDGDDFQTSSLRRLASGSGRCADNDDRFLHNSRFELGRSINQWLHVRGHLVPSLLCRQSGQSGTWKTRHMYTIGE